MRRLFLAFVAVAAFACGSESPVSPTAAQMPSPAPRPEVWFNPAPHSRDFLDMFEHPDEWTKARARMTAFGFFQGNTFPGVQYPRHVENTFENFLTVGRNEDGRVIGAFRWLGDHEMPIFLEAGSVKPETCDDERWQSVWAIKGSLAGITANGGRVKYVSQDEPFTAAMRGGVNNITGQILRSCGYTVERTAKEVKAWMDAVHGDARSVTVMDTPTLPAWIHDSSVWSTPYPDVDLGLIEPYPEFTVPEIEQFILALEHEGVRLPYFHLDVDIYRAQHEELDLTRDLPRLQAFLKEHHIVFGMIIWGESGLSNERYYNDAVKFSYQVRRAMGTPDRLIFESWSRYMPAAPVDDVRYPDNLPESQPATHTGLLNIMTRYFEQQE